MFALALAALTVVSAGCYTVLRHPTDVVVQDTHAEYRTCADCHDGAAYYHPYFHYARSHDRWGRYYGDPWWYSDYWYWTPHGSGSAGEPRDVETGTRHLWGNSGWASDGWGFRTPPSTATSGRDDGAQQEEPKKEEKQEKKKETDEQHLWKPAKKGF